MYSGFETVPCTEHAGMQNISQNMIVVADLKKGSDVVMCGSLATISATCSPGAPRTVTLSPPAAMLANRYLGKQGKRKNI